MKICDLTQFYSPLSGGVKRYVHEKINYIQTTEQAHEHVLIVPGSANAVKVDGRSRIYSVRSPVVSRASQYRVFVNLRAIDEILEKERPDIIESADPYQLGWKAIRSGRAFGIPVVGFYHSHFVSAYLAGVSRRFGKRAGEKVTALARNYVRHLYNRMEATLVPSVSLQTLLESWGLHSVRAVRLGVNTNIFTPIHSADGVSDSESGIGRDRTLLLYVGRLAPEKNTAVLFAAFRILTERYPNEFHLLVIGDGAQRTELQWLRSETEAVTWIPYCTDAEELARYYRASDLLVHPGVEETFGLVALESQACGTPVVGIRGTRLDSVILHHQIGWADENSPKGLAAAIKHWSDDPNRLALGAAASERAHHEFNWPTVLDRLFCIYAEICANYKLR